MEKKLEQMFDYQKFEDNASLGKLIESVHARYASRALDLEELSMVNAAGIIDKAEGTLKGTVISKAIKPNPDRKA